MEKLNSNLTDTQNLQEMEFKSNLENFSRPNGFLNGYISVKSVGDQTLTRTHFLLAFVEKMKSAFGYDSRRNPHLIRNASIHFLRSGEKWCKKPEIFQQVLGFAKETGIVQSDARQATEESIEEIWERVVKTSDQEDPNQPQTLEQISSKKNIFSPIIIKSGIASLGTIGAVAGGYWLWKPSQFNFWPPEVPSENKDPKTPDKDSTIPKDKIPSKIIEPEQPVEPAAQNTSSEQSFPKPPLHPFSPVPSFRDFIFEKTDSQHLNLDSEPKIYPNMTPNFFTEPKVNSSNTMTYLSVSFVGLSALCGLAYLLYCWKKGKSIGSSLAIKNRVITKPPGNSSRIKNGGSSGSNGNSPETKVGGSSDTNGNSSETKGGGSSDANPLSRKDDSSSVKQNHDPLRPTGNLSEIEVRGSSSANPIGKEVDNSPDPNANPLSKQVGGSSNPIDNSEESIEESEDIAEKLQKMEAVPLLNYATECLSTDEGQEVVSLAFDKLLGFGAQYARQFAVACLGYNTTEAKKVVAEAFDILLKENALEAKYFALECLKYDTPESQDVVGKAVPGFLQEEKNYLFALEFAKACFEGKNSKSSQVLGEAYTMLLPKTSVFAEQFANYCLGKGNQGVQYYVPAFLQKSESIKDLFSKDSIIEFLKNDKESAYQCILACLQKGDDVSKNHFQDCFQMILTSYSDQLYLFTQYLLKSGKEEAEKEGIRKAINNEFHTFFQDLLVIKNDFPKAWAFLNEYFKYEKELSLDFAHRVFLALLIDSEINHIEFLKECAEQKSSEVDKDVKLALRKLCDQYPTLVDDLIKSGFGVKEIDVYISYISNYWFKKTALRCFKSIKTVEFSSDKIVELLLSEKIEEESENLMQEVLNFFKTGKSDLIFEFLKVCLGRNNPSCKHISELAYQILLEKNEPGLACKFAKKCLEINDQLFTEAFELTLQTKFTEFGKDSEIDLKRALEGNRHLIFELLAAIPKTNKTLTDNTIKILSERLDKDAESILKFIKQHFQEFIKTNELCLDRLVTAFVKLLTTLPLQYRNGFLTSCNKQEGDEINLLLDKVFEKMSNGNEKEKELGITLKEYYDKESKARSDLHSIGKKRKAQIKNKVEEKRTSRLLTQGSQIPESGVSSKEESKTSDNPPIESEKSDDNSTNN